MAINQGDLINGIWYDDIANPLFMDGYRVSYMKIYSLGISLRIMEISTYPRAYYRDVNHYTVDTPFTVMESDLNNTYYLAMAAEMLWQLRPEIPDGTRVYVNVNGEVWMLGETAYHRIGETIPDTTPLWVESELLSTPSNVDSKKDVFPVLYTALKGELASINITEGQYREDVSSIWTPVPAAYLDALEEQLTIDNQKFSVNKLIHGKDRLVAQLLYDRNIRIR